MTESLDETQAQAWIIKKQENRIKKLEELLENTIQLLGQVSCGEHEYDIPCKQCKAEEESRALKILLRKVLETDTK